MNKKHLIIGSISLVIICSSSFYGGIHYSSGQQPDPSALGRARNFRTGTAIPNAGMIMGEMIKKDDESITVKLETGSRIIFYSPKTEVNKMVSASTDELETGTRVSVRGNQNEDGSVTAEQIQIIAPQNSEQEPEERSEDQGMNKQPTNE